CARSRIAVARAPTSPRGEWVAPLRFSSKSFIGGCNGSVTGPWVKSLMNAFPGHPPGPSAGHPVQYGTIAPVSLLTSTVEAIPPTSAEALAAAEAAQERLTKPSGSLGLVEAAGNRLAAIAGQCPPPVPEPAAV